jgi:erythronate-4-phosphate dehydrogenase
MSDEEFLHQLIRHAYDIAADDRRLREAMEMDSEERGRHFDDLRRDYPVRREFCNYVVESNRSDPALITQLRTLGFRIAMGVS